MSVLLASFLVVVLAEMGDKTQLVALTLGLRYRRPWTVMLGILMATLLNHALAAALGAWGATKVDPRLLGWLVGFGFIAFGVWTLFPDRASEPRERRGWGPLLTTTVVFFTAEMGDKTQLATVALGAHYAATIAVTMGTTLGMLVADGLAVFIGSRFATVIPLPLFRRFAAALFFLFGVLSILGGIRAGSTG